MPGHTHEDIDQLFSRIAANIAKNNIRILTGIFVTWWNIYYGRYNYKAVANEKNSLFFLMIIAILTLMMSISYATSYI